MTDHPMLFSAPMIRALLSGLKTQTRRLAGVPVIENTHNGIWHVHNRHGGNFVASDDMADVAKAAADYLPIQPADRIWVKENWRTFGTLDGVKPIHLRTGSNGTRGAGIYYEAGGNMAITVDGSRTYGDGEQAGLGKLRPCIHLPKWASRLTLHVTEVRVQRLQDISAADAEAEGIELMRETETWGKQWRNYGAEGAMDRSAVYSYRTLWNMVQGHTGIHQLPVEPWSLNPWVAAYTFTVTRGNIDD